MEIKVYTKFETEFYTELEKFQKKAKKLSKTFFWQERSSGSEEIKPGKFLEYRMIEIVSEHLSIDGWKLSAQKKLNNGICVIIGIGEKEENWLLDVEFRGKIQCHHCNQDRRRLKSYILEHEDGYKVEVGSTCVNEFVNNLSALKIAEMLAGLMYYLEAFEKGQKDYEKMLLELSEEEEGGYFKTGQIAFEIRKVIALASYVHSIQGFKKSQEYGSNKDKMIDHATDGSSIWRNMPEAHLEIADKILAFYGNAEENGLGGSEFDQNMIQYAALKSVTNTGFGFMAYMPVHFHKWENEKKQLASKGNEFFGTEKKREKNILAQVSQRKIVETDYGFYELLSFTTVKDGNVLVWWNSGQRTELEVGDVVIMDATVKKHQVSRYSGMKETTISRAACKKIEE